MAGSKSQIEQILRQTLADARLSRGEKSAMSRLTEEWAGRAGDLGLARKLAFELASEELSDRHEREVLGWLEDVMKVLAPVDVTQNAIGGAFKPVDCRFSPGDDCLDLILDCIRRARRSLDICVFTISDDRISREIQRAYGRGVQLRLITDDDKQFDLGSDIGRLRDSGIRVKTDESPAHMHHKFAIVDREWLLTGSYNWTRSAATRNMENVISILNPDAVAAYQIEFDRLWEEL